MSFIFRPILFLAAALFSLLSSYSLSSWLGLKALSLLFIFFTLLQLSLFLIRKWSVKNLIHSQIVALVFLGSFGLVYIFAIKPYLLG